MRILHLEASLGWGGQEIRILRESEGMRQRGHEVILGVSKNGGLVNPARQEGFTVFELNFSRPFWLFTFFKLLWIFWYHKIDLVNTHSSLDSWIGGLAARAARIPILRTRHLSTAIKKGWNSRFLYGSLADFVVTTCSSIVPVISSQSGKPPSLCRSIPTGVDPVKISYDTEAAARFRAEIGVKTSDFLVGTACFMRSWKGIDDFLLAANLLRSFSEIKWVVIGGGHSEKYLRKAAELHLEGIVHFAGHLQNPFPALGALDIFALLSTAHEGVSQAILQAAYLEKPLIATPVGGLNEVCIDRQTGLQVPPFNPEAVARSVLELKENKEFSLKLAQNAKSLVINRFTMQDTLDQMEAVYHQLLKV